jgi:hypothetical protein
MGRLMCGQCGSIRTRIVAPERLEWLAVILLRQQVVVCGRCGWRGRKSKRAGQIVPGPSSLTRSGVNLEPAPGHVDEEIDPDLAAIDRALGRPDKDR